MWIVEKPVGKSVGQNVNWSFPHFLNFSRAAQAFFSTLKNKEY